MRLRVGGAAVELRSNDADLRGWLAGRFVDLTHPGDDEPDHRVRIDRTDEGTVLEIDDAVWHSNRNVANVVDHFVSWCNRMAIESRPDHLNLHAAGLMPPNGDRCILVPGAPGAGKSSVTCAAMAAGWGYLSDELVSIDTSGMAHSYPKPITLKQGTKALLPHVDFDSIALGERQLRWYLRPAELGGSPTAIAQPFAVVFSEYRSDETTSMSPMSATEATVELATNAQDELDDHGGAFLRMARVASTTQCFRMTQRDLTEAVAQLGQMVDRAEAVTPPPSLLATPPPADSPVGPRIADGAIAISLADGVAVHHPDTQALVALDPLAGTIWQLLDGSVTEGELAADLATAFEHEPGQIQRDLRALLAQLDDQRLIS